jgi:polyribonucleotide nucleotidyltransferase
MDKREYSIEIDGKKITAEFNDLADQAHGSVILRMGDTAVLATAVMSQGRKEGSDFFPLTVDYEERFYAVGKILGSRFMKRRIRNEIQVVITVLSIGEDSPDILGVTAASLALGTSDIPWNGPVTGVRVGQKDESGEMRINPIYSERENPYFEMVACGKDGKINMIEVGGHQVGESYVVEALKKASENIERMQEWQNKIISEIGKLKREVVIETIKEEVVELFKKEISPKLDSAIFSGPGKASIEKLKDEWMEMVEEKLPETNVSLALDLYENAVNDVIHKEAIENDRRADGRKMNELRPLFAKAGGISNVVHGSGVFYRGGTHILSILTLGGPEDSQLVNDIEEYDSKKSFYHHYNFPPFSTGEVGRVGSTNRRMIGHGALAEKALSYVIPSQEEFPYTIRLVSEAMASNGSTSMGSVCGSTLALMDGGVPIKEPVAGIASGLMMDDKGRYKILTDIQGPEDHHGDMDFKVAGTKNGITAIQMDIKVGGIPINVLDEALVAAKEARLKILDVILKEINGPRKNISPNAPEVLITRVKKDQIGFIIGSGGKTINEIKEKTGAEINIEDDGKIYITGKNGSAGRAKDIIEGMTKEYKAGEKYEGEVIKVMDFGAFVRISPWAEGLVHISEIAPFRVNSVSDYIKEGDRVPVMVKGIDERERIALSIKMANPELFKEKGK